MDENLNRKYIYPGLAGRLKKNESCVFATVVETHGSTPQKPGSSAIFSNVGLLDGTVGGGKVEFIIQKKSVESLKTKNSGYYRFDLNDEIDEDNSVICGGGMNILIDATPEKHLPVFNALNESCKNRIPGVLVTMAGMDEPGDFKIERFWIDKENIQLYANKFDAGLMQEIKAMLEKTRPGVFSELVRHTSPEYEDRYIFLESIVPLPRLLIAGAGHVGKALAHFGKLLDFEVTVWDDREEYANYENIPDADYLLTGNLNDTLGKVTPGADTFIVIVTRGHNNDSDVLREFINTGAGYIGMIGSRKKIAQVREQFITKSWATPEQWEKIHAPIGLNISSKTVQEIAVSIAAQLVQVRCQLNKENE
jgi:xanthine dehydrogenase accessory factor